MPALTTPGGGGALGVSSAGPIQLGTMRFSWGPYHINRVRQPNTYRQQGINAWLLNDYGILPNQYILEGYATGNDAPYWPDPTLIDQINALFSDPLAAVKLLVPYQGIATTVRLVRLTDDTDSTKGPGEVTFRLELEEMDGALTSREGN